MKISNGCFLWNTL